MRPCIEPTCGEYSMGTRCPSHTRERDRRRGSTTQRGYGAAHQQARAELAATLPDECGYGCGATLYPGAPWVAAHVVDGDESAGWMAACLGCNERAKRR